MAQGPLPVTVKHRIGKSKTTRNSYAELLAFRGHPALASRRSPASRRMPARPGSRALNPKQNAHDSARCVYDLVHDGLSAKRPELLLELNGGLLELPNCQAQLPHVDGVMVGRAAYDHPAALGSVDCGNCFGVADHQAAVGLGGCCAA